MMHCATQKSLKVGRRSRALWLVLVGTALAGRVVVLSADQPPSPEQVANMAYRATKEQYESAADDPRVAWHYARACFDWAEFSSNDTRRAELAREGIDACERALANNGELAPAHYYLGMNQGQLARTMSIGALKLVQQMEEHFQQARELEPTFDQAGPDRNLGLLYLEAPGWPVSVGNRSKAGAHLVQAVKLAPHFPENRLNLMEAYARWNERTLVKREMRAWEENLEAARRQFSGSRWHWAWVKWEQRFDALKEQLAKPKPVLRSPKDGG